jgi:hypothetical protein
VVHNLVARRGRVLGWPCAPHSQKAAATPPVFVTHLVQSCRNPAKIVVLLPMVSAASTSNVSSCPPAVPLSTCSAGEPTVFIDDLRHARELALLTCKSEAAIDTFLGHCNVAARNLLMPYGHVLMALSILLRMKRTLDGPEIDRIIADVETAMALAIERYRKADWRKRELAASCFRGHFDAAPLPHLGSDQER